MSIEVIKPPNKKFVEKLWGKEEWIVNNQRYCGKILYLNPGFQCSRHFHTIKSETFLVLDGVVKMEFGAKGQDIYYLTEGMSVEIPVLTIHRFQAIASPAKVVEFSSPHREEDVTRLEESSPVEPIT